MNLKEKTTQWAEQKIITAKQRADILSYESQKDRWSWGPFLLGTFFVLLGMLSLVASHWIEMSDHVKLGASFLGLAALLGGTYYGFRSKKPFLFEGCLFATFLFCGVMIGIVGQIFNLGGTMQEAALLWAIATLPLVVISTQRLTGFCWVPLFLGGVIQENWWHSLFELYQEQPLGNTIILGAWLAAVASVLRLVHLPFLKALQKWSYILLYANFIIGDFYVSENVSVLAGAVVTILFLTAGAFANVCNGNQRAFKGNLLLIALRVLVLYFQVFISLAFTGIGLILSGIVLLGLWGAWRKISARLSVRLKGATHE